MRTGKAAAKTVAGGEEVGARRPEASSIEELEAAWDLLGTVLKPMFLKAVERILREEKGRDRLGGAGG